MSDLNQKKAECQGCMGFTDVHTCNQFNDFAKMLAAKVNACEGCKAKDKRIEELEAELENVRDAAQQEARRYNADNERLRAALQEIADSGVAINSSFNWIATLAKQALKGVDDE